MDPTANVAEQLKLAQWIRESVDRGERIDPDDAARLAELVEGLDAWIRTGGFLPAPWSRASTGL